MTLAPSISTMAASSKTYELSHKTETIQEIFKGITNILDEIPVDQIRLGNGNHSLFLRIEQKQVQECLDTALQKMTKGWFPALQKKSLDNDCYATLSADGQRVHKVLCAYRQAVESFAREIHDIQSKDKSEAQILESISEIRVTFLKHDKALDQALRKQIPAAKNRSLVKRILLFSIPFLVGIGIAVMGPGTGFVGGAVLGGLLIGAGAIGYALNAWDLSRTWHDKPWATFKSAVDEFLTQGRATDQDLVSQMLLITKVHQSSIFGHGQVEVGHSDMVEHDIGEYVEFKERL